ncbi:MAG: hypothetical protein ACFCVA_16760 [Gammaproteobacteria bacterium]
MRAVLTDRGLPGNVLVGEGPEPQPAPHEALIRVKAFSLNRGELNFAQDRPRGSRIGWDVAGSVLQCAADGTGPAVDARVVGFVKAANGWAEVGRLARSLMERRFSGKAVLHLDTSD